MLNEVKNLVHGEQHPPIQRTRCFTEFILSLSKGSAWHSGSSFLAQGGSRFKAGTIMRIILGISRSPFHGSLEMTGS